MADAQENERQRQIEIAKAKFKFKQQQQGGEQEESGGLLDKALGVGLKALDFTGGLTRTAGAGLAELVTGEDILKEGDFSKAFHGEAPGTAEFLERGGVLETDRVDLFPEFQIPFTDIKLGEGDSSTREAVGFAGDVLLDPLNLATGGAAGALKGLAKVGGKTGKLLKGAAKTGEVIARPFKELSHDAGTSLFKRAFKRADAAVTGGRKSRGTPVADLFLEEGDIVSKSSAFEKLENLNKIDVKKQSRILDRATESGVKVSGETVVSPARRFVDRVAKKDKDLAREMTDVLDEIAGVQKSVDPITGRIIKAPKQFTPTEANFLKTKIGQKIPQRSRDAGPQIQSVYVALEKAVEEGARKAGNNLPVFGKQLKKVNKRLSTQLGASKGLQRDAINALGKPLVTQTKAGIGAIEPTAAAAALAAQGVLSTPFLTGTGLGLRKLSKLTSGISPKAGRALGVGPLKIPTGLVTTPGADTVLRQALLGSQNEETRRPSRFKRLGGQ